ncbi:40S ribosomal protein S15a-like [Olea europaea var. sylvestris]|uniref:40S ribosomal protein S15a-like n=1 Tax=Olea europaea var. sylvestris TaxID=158386 RepID=UPI000C1D2936|nr:40S ribosomal protein S15a-like [Olea europaea var. sylvestris]
MKVLDDWKSDTLESLSTSMITDLVKLWLNKCRVISPDFDVAIQEIEEWNARLLPFWQFWIHLLASWSMKRLGERRLRGKVCNPCAN